jgi:hypothetical protein
MVARWAVGRSAVALALAPVPSAYPGGWGLSALTEGWRRTPAPVRGKVAPFLRRRGLGILVMPTLV